jgi:hypothetical protein
MRDDGALSDEAVIARVRAGDLAIFELIMRRYNQRRRGGGVDEQRIR